jgi:hypothetical protein
LFKGFTQVFKFQMMWNSNMAATNPTIAAMPIITQ